MKLFSVASAVALAIPFLACVKCQADNCYFEWVDPPNCVEGQPCIEVVYRAEVCPWNCGVAVPDNCQQRCKPCNDTVCPPICICEKVCKIEE